MSQPAIPEKETLAIEFKSDCDPLDDDNLIKALICLANAHGGKRYRGVENVSTGGGLHPKVPLQVVGLVAGVATRTYRPVSPHQHLQITDLKEHCGNMEHCRAPTSTLDPWLISTSLPSKSI